MLPDLVSPQDSVCLCTLSVRGSEPKELSRLCSLSKALSRKSDRSTSSDVPLHQTLSVFSSYPIDICIFNGDIYYASRGESMCEDRE